MKMLMFDFRDTEKEYFKENTPTDLEIEFFKEPLSDKFHLTDSQKEDTVILSVFINSELTPEILSQFKNLQVVATRSTGYNHINLDYCKKNNIAVINTPYYGKSSVAQYTIGMIITLTRKVMLASNDVKNRNIDYSKYEGENLSKLSLGVVGTGSIGSAVCELANKFNLKIYAHDLKVNENINGFVEYVDFDELISKSDIITLHIPYILEFYHLLSEEKFKKMKQGVYIINTSRGELIDTGALYKNIKSGKVKGAALDVLECEYLKYDKEEIVTTVKNASETCLENVIITDKLMEFDNVIITPHIAYNTKQSIMNILESMFIAIKEHYHGGYLNRVI